MGGHHKLPTLGLHPQILPLLVPIPMQPAQKLRIPSPAQHKLPKLKPLNIFHFLLTIFQDIQLGAGRKTRGGLCDTTILFPAGAETCRVGGCAAWDWVYGECGSVDAGYEEEEQGEGLLQV